MKHNYDRPREDRSLTKSSAPILLDNSKKTHRLKKIVFVSPDISVQGGISTVVKGYLNTDLTKKYRIITVSSHVDGPKLFKLFQAIFGLMKLFAILLFNKIDIAHIHGSDMTSSSRKYFYFKLVKCFRVKTIYHFHGAFFMEQYHRVSSFRQNLVKEVFAGADVVICLSKSWSDAIRGIVPIARIRVIGNSVSLPEQVSSVRQDGEPIKICFLGLLGKRKGVFDLLEAVKRLAADGLHCSLDIGGNGEVGKLRSEIQRLSLASSVKFHGWISEKQRDLMLKHANIFVLPSYGEGMPMSILEAMSYGLPIISTNVGGIPELVRTGENGFLIAPGDIDDLYEKLRSLIQNVELRRSFGVKSREIIERQFSLEANVREIENIYDLLAGETTTPVDRHISLNRFEARRWSNFFPPH